MILKLAGVLIKYFTARWALDDLTIPRFKPVIVGIEPCALSTRPSRRRLLCINLFFPLCMIDSYNNILFKNWLNRFTQIWYLTFISFNQLSFLKYYFSICLVIEPLTYLLRYFFPFCRGLSKSQTLLVKLLCPASQRISPSLSDILSSKILMSIKQTNKVERNRILFLISNIHLYNFAFCKMSRK